jgi:hypothetical protein
VERTPQKSYQLFRIILNSERAIAFLTEKNYMRFIADGLCAPQSQRHAAMCPTWASIAMLI